MSMKKILILLTVAVLTLMLISCEGNAAEESSSAPPSEISEETSEQTSEQVSETTSEQADGTDAEESTEAQTSDKNNIELPKVDF